MSLSKITPTSHFGKADDGVLETAGSATIGDLPPEVLTLLLEYLLDGNRNNMLNYRLINSQWKEIIDSLLEKKMVSGVFQPFPQLRFGYDKYRQWKLYAERRPTLTLFLEGKNPFPFNSLAVKGRVGGSDRGNTNFYKVPSGLLNFGGNLSTFALSNHYVTFNELGTMLGSMLGLKHLRLSGLRLIDIPNNDVIPTPPPLPSLSSLDLKSERWIGDDAEIVYVWLVASYADQLVRLNLETVEAIQALRKEHQYFHSISTGAKLLLAPTSESAFGKLKELKISEPSSEFLRLSVTPSLQRFSVIGLARQSRASFDDLTKFLDGCSRTLQNLFVDVSEHEWAENCGIRCQPKVAASKLKVLTFRYPIFDYNKTILYERIVPKFSGLEVLQLIWFGTWLDGVRLDSNYDDVELELGSDEEKQRCGLKLQLASLREREIALQGELDAALDRELDVVKKRTIAGQTKGVCGKRPLGTAETRLHFQRKEEQAAIKQKIAVVGNEIFPLVNQLYVLHRKGTIARELREQGIWSSCPKLKFVSISSGEKPCGDICIMSRINDELL